MASLKRARPPWDGWRPWFTVVTLLTAWGLAAHFSLVNRLFLPTLAEVAASGAEMLKKSDLYRDAWASLYRALGGLLISFVLAVPLGLVFGRVPRLYAFFEFPVDFFRSIPSSALFFLFILLFGIGDVSKIAVVVYGCALILLVGSLYGARATREKQDRIDMLKSFGARKRQIFFLCVLPDAIPHVAASLRVSASLSLVLVIVTEMFLSANDGLGHRMYDYYLAYQIPQMYCVLLLLGLLGYCINRGAVALERTVAFWGSPS